MMKHWMFSSEASEQHMTPHGKSGHVAEIAEKYENPRLGGRKKKQQPQTRGGQLLASMRLIKNN